VSARQSANGRSPPPPADADAAGYRPDPSTPLRRCACGGYWTDDEPGRHAHRVVFSHEPEPANPSRNRRDHHDDQ
jgi:hypothetical protein